MKKKFDIIMPGCLAFLAIIAISDIRAYILKRYKEHYSKGFEAGDNSGRKDAKIDILFELAKDGVITVADYNKYVAKVYNL